MSGGPPPPARISAHPSAVTGRGCLGWAARIPGTLGLLVLLGAAADLVKGGPVPSSQAIVAGGFGLALVVIFVYVGALADAGFDQSSALARVLRVFVQDVLLLGVVALVAMLSSVGSGSAGGGGGGAGGRSSSPARRINFASELVDPMEFASILEVATARPEASGLSSSEQSRALVVATDERGRRRPRVSISVYQGRIAELVWVRAARSGPAAAGPGEAAVSSGDRLTFRHGDTVVTLRLSAFRGDVTAKLRELAAAVDRRLTGPVA